MKGWARPDYSYFGGKTPLQRHLENERSKATKKQWPLLEEVTQKDIDELRSAVQGEIEYCIHRNFLASHELSRVLQERNKGRKRQQKIEYYDFLEQFKNEDCIPAAEDVLAGRFPARRAALLQRLRDQGIEVTVENAL